MKSIAKKSTTLHRQLCIQERVKGTVLKKLWFFTIIKFKFLYKVLRINSYKNYVNIMCYLNAKVDDRL